MIDLYDPYGVNPQSGDIKKNVHEFYQGDSIILKIAAKVSNEDPVTEENADATFTLVDKRFSIDPIWTGTWGDGITLLKDGVVEVRVPDRISKDLRRGSFLYSLTLLEKPIKISTLVEEGTLLIEFGADAPNIDLAYKNTNSECDANQNEQR